MGVCCAADPALPALAGVEADAAACASSAIAAAGAVAGRLRAGMGSLRYRSEPSREQEIGVR